MRLAAFIDIGYVNLSTLIVDLDQLQLYLTDEKSVDSGIYEWRVDNIKEVQHQKCEGVLKKGGQCGKKAVWLRKKNSSTDYPLYCCRLHCKDEKQYKKCPKPKRGTLVNLIDRMYQLYNSMDNLKFVVSADVEKQVSINAISRELGSAAYCWFVMHRVTNNDSEYKLKNLTMFSNKRKLKVWKGKRLVVPEYREKKRQRKWLAVAYTDLYLLRDDVWHDVFEGSKKKDDLADTFLMAVWRVVGPGGAKPLGVASYGYKTYKGREVDDNENW